MTLDFTCIADLKCRVGESPVYDERTEPALLRRYPEPHGLSRSTLASGDLASWTFESEVGSLGLAASGRARRGAARQRHPLRSGDRRRGRSSAASRRNRPETRLNDGRSARTARSGSAAWTTGRKRSRSARSTASIRPARSSARSRACRLQRPRLDRRRRDHVPRRFARALDRSLALRPLDRGDVGAHALRRRSTRRPAGRTAAAATPRVSTGAPASPPGASTASRRTAVCAEAYDVPVPAPTMPCFGGAGFPHALPDQPARGALRRSCCEARRSPARCSPRRRRSPVSRLAVP